MNKKQKVFDLVSRSLAPTVNTKKMLAVLPTHLYLKGFLLESTIEKNRYFLWKLVMPLYTPARFVDLSYGNRLANSKTILIEDRASSIKFAAEEVLQILTLEQSLDYLARINSPADFLAHVTDKLRNEVVPNQFDFAVTYFLLGMHAEVINLLQAAIAKAARVSEDFRKRHEPTMTLFLRTLQSNPESAIELIQEWRQANIETLGLQEAVRLSLSL